MGKGCARGGTVREMARTPKVIAKNAKGVFTGNKFFTSLSRPEVTSFKTAYILYILS